MGAIGEGGMALHAVPHTTRVTSTPWQCIDGLTYFHTVLLNLGTPVVAMIVVQVMYKIQFRQFRNQLAYVPRRRFVRRVRPRPCSYWSGRVGVSTVAGRCLRSTSDARRSWPSAA